MPLPRRLCSRGSGESIIRSAASQSWKRRAFSAVIHCSAQEYDTSSTTKDEENNCEKNKGDRQTSTTRSVQYSGVGSKTGGAASLVAAVAVCVGVVCYSENTELLVQEASRVQRVLALCHYWRRSTIEVHPKFSEAPHLRSSIPLPKN